LIGIATFPNIFPLAPLFRIAVSPSHVFQFPALLAMSALTALAS
jgi:hypothetical protein